MSRVRVSLLAMVVLALVVVTASAQPIISAKSGVIAGVEGKAFLDNQPVESSVTHFPDMKDNSVLRTEDGRAEVLLPPGYVLRLGENGSLRMLTNRLIDTRVELLAGSAVVEVDAVDSATNVTVALKAGTVRLAKVGVYRLDSEPALVKVFRGSASVQLGDQTILVSTGHMLSLTGDSASVEKFDVEQMDALDTWSLRRGQAMALANLSAAKSVRDNYGNLHYNTWGFNPYFGMYTFIPMNGRMCNSFYGSCYWSPAGAYSTFFAPHPTYTGGGFGGYNSGLNSGYSAMGSGSSGASSVSMASSASSSPAMSSASTSSSAAASSSAGHGSAASGGHGK